MLVGGGCLRAIRINKAHTNDTNKWKDEELAIFINQYLDNPSLDRTGRKKIVDQYVQFTDGRSYKRSVDFLDNLI